ncbi:MAG TPA: DUF4157 domain-containing protein, partial [Thermoanaerobaculia bacterium]|nr:DUF4157 domain-containing protein [Thermoanaerobaculia bacterium]
MSEKASFSFKKTRANTGERNPPPLPAQPALDRSAMSLLGNQYLLRLFASQAGGPSSCQGASKAVSEPTSNAVQLRASPSGSSVHEPAAIHQQAERGLVGPTQRLPHLDAIQRSFGHHAVGDVRSHVAGPAAQASQAIGALAYTVGNAVAFREAPDLRTAAHEAAHVVQQRAGVQLDGGVGDVGDRYERNADAVANEVAWGRTSEALLDAYEHGGASGLG